MRRPFPVFFFVKSPFGEFALFSPAVLKYHAGKACVTPLLVGNLQAFCPCRFSNLSNLHVHLFSLTLDCYFFFFPFCVLLLLSKRFSMRSPAPLCLYTFHFLPLLQQIKNTWPPIFCSWLEWRAVEIILPTNNSLLNSLGGWLVLAFHTPPFFNVLRWDEILNHQFLRSFVLKDICRVVRDWTSFYFHSPHQQGTDRIGLVFEVLFISHPVKGTFLAFLTFFPLFLITITSIFSGPPQRGFFSVSPCFFLGSQNLPPPVVFPPFSPLNFSCLVEFIETVLSTYLFLSFPSRSRTPPFPSLFPCMVLICSTPLPLSFPSFLAPPHSFFSWVRLGRLGFFSPSRESSYNIPNGLRKGRFARSFFFFAHFGPTIFFSGRCFLGHLSHTLAFSSLRGLLFFNGKDGPFFYS